MQQYPMTRQRASRGMTLVELLMVMAIFSVVMMAVISLFIPAVKSTAVQTQVTDVQSNLRLAMTRMTQDLLTAGFLTGTAAPIIFEGTVPTAPDYINQDFTIQTRAVGGGFARVVSASSSVLTLSQSAMVDNFPQDCFIRLYEPVSATELEGVVYQVTAKGANTLTISPAAGVTIPDETVVVRIRDNSQPAMQTIRYRLIDNSLVRVVNDSTQLLARNVGNINFRYEYSPSGRVSKVNVTLEGETKALGTDAISSQKTRELQSSVALRNTF